MSALLTITWQIALATRNAGESAREHVARVIRACDGVSLDHERNKLEALFWANETPERAASVCAWATNCATVTRQALALAGCTHPRIVAPLASEMAMAWVLEAASDMGALVPASTWARSHAPIDAWATLGAGMIAHYWSSGNNDHLETCLDRVCPDTGFAAHGGGGRGRNAIAVEPPSDMRFSRGRPLQHVLDPALMCPA